jgi:N-acyl homoserine lactone hydrolase
MTAPKEPPAAGLRRKPQGDDRVPVSTSKVKAIHAIQTGRVQIKKAQIEGRGAGFWRQLQPILSEEWAEWTPTYAWVIEHAEGVIVVDTGAAAHLNQLPKWHPYFSFAVHFDIAPEQEIGPQLRALGIGPRDVKTVVLTHMHIDHDGGLAHFPHSRILASPGEIARTSGIKGALLGYMPKRWPSWFAPESVRWQPTPFGSFASSMPLTNAGDVVAVPTPGHTPNHLSVVVREGDVDVLLAGDASYLERTMLSGTIDGVSPDAGVAVATLGTIKQFCTGRPVVYLPSHDPGSASRLAARRLVGAV